MLYIGYLRRKGFYSFAVLQVDSPSSGGPTDSGSVDSRGCSWYSTVERCFYDVLGSKEAAEPIPDLYNNHFMRMILSEYATRDHQKSLEIHILTIMVK